MAASATFATTYAASAKSTIWREVRQDAERIEAGRDPFASPLWPSPFPDWFDAADDRAQAIWQSDPPTWDFWQRWWQGVKSGNPLDSPCKKKSP